MISIDHTTKVITIPKADTTFVETNAVTGYEVRSYDEYALMRELADYLDSEEGFVLPPAFNHSTNVTISGVVYARSLTFLAPYTILFEPGVYQVKLVGGTNNNMLDVLNPNNVSVIPANSAGLQRVVSGSGVTAQDKADIVTGVYTEIIEATYNLKQILRLLAAQAVGDGSNLEGGNPSFVGLDGLTTRIAANYVSGARTITLLDAS